MRLWLYNFGPLNFEIKYLIRGIFLSIFRDMREQELDIKSLWSKSLGILKEEINSINFKMWILPIEPVSYQNNSLTLSVDSPFALKMLNERLILDLKRAVQESSGSATKIIITSRHSTKVKSNKSPKPKNKEYNFDSFIVGPSNELAFAACKQFSDFSETDFNPLYVYSNVGLGKTHLLLSIHNSLQKQGLKVKYVTSERFTNEFIRSIKEKKTEFFRSEYRSCDALIVDDIQFLSGKMQTQEGFFHTFNDLYLENKKIILAGDDPSRLVEVEARLTSRFQSGLVVDIQPPDYETKVAIIEFKAERLSLQINNEIIDYVAQLCQVNIRQIESILNRLKAMTQLKEEILDIDSAKSMIIGFDDIKISNKPMPSEVLKEVAAQLGVSEEEIKSDSRSAQIVYARRISGFILNKDLNLTLAASGSLLGNKNHATILNAVRFVEGSVDTDFDLRYNLQRIRNSLKII